MFEEAAMDYFAVLNKISNHVPTLKGLGETYYELAFANIKTSTDYRYLEYIQQSIKVSSIFRFVFKANIKIVKQ